MSSAELLATLNDLKVNRRIPAEIAAAIDPLRGQQFTLELTFGSSTRTFGNRFDSSYDNGYTATCKTVETDLEVSVLFPPSDNSTIEGRASGDIFETQVILLDFDGLYQRAILGCPIEEGAPPDEEQGDEKPGEDESPVVEKEDRMEEEDSAEVEIEEPDELPEETGVRRAEIAYPVEREFESRDQGDPDPKTSASRKKWVNVVAAAAGFEVVWCAAMQWQKVDSIGESVFWAFLIYPLGLGLTCFANRSRVPFYIALAAFIFDLTGTYLYYSMNGSGERYYNAALVLQAIALLGLAISLARKNLSRWPLIMALLFAGYTYNFLQFEDAKLINLHIFTTKPIFPFLVALGFCCWTIIISELQKKPKEMQPQ